MLLGTGVALAAIPLYLGLRDAQGVTGLAWAGVIAMTANAGATHWWMRARYGGPDLVPLLSTGARAAAIAVAAGLAASASLPGDVGRLAAVQDLVFGGVVFAAVAGLLMFVLGDETLRGLLRAPIQLLRRQG